MPALGERGSATRATCLLRGRGRAGVPETLWVDPISTRAGDGPGCADAEEGAPVRRASGLRAYCFRVGPRTPDPPGLPSFQQRKLRVASPETTAGIMSGAL